MPLAAGQTLTHYEILGPLGAGGMGEVYRAKDTRLEREVAIKVLPEELADDEERLRRFEREAKTLASLNHPNVAGIHGVDQEDDICFLALELVPGEDLAARLSRGPLPVDEAIDVCRQIAEGLEAAHEAGVVHRDLKPANVRITPEGKAKILDFGLAKPTPPGASEAGTTSARPDSFLVTEEGLVLGTPTYMSPEQARGRPVDRRTDIWAFGCVLFECLSGRRAFYGDTFGDVVVSVVSGEPDWSVLPPLPRRVTELLRRTFTKDPQSRLRDAGEARIMLELAGRELAGESVDDAAGAASTAAALAAPVAPRARPPVASLAAVLAAASLAAAGTWFLVPRFGAVARAPDVRFDVVLPRGDDFASNYNRVVAIAPDASAFAYISDGGLYVRSLDRTEPQVIPDTLESRSPAFSHDSRQFAYWHSGHIKRASIGGGVPVAVTAMEHRPMGLHWASDDFVYVGRADLGIWRVPVSGGALEQVIELEDRELAHGPELLPGGEWLMFSLSRGVRAWSNGSIVAQSLATGERRVLVERGREPRYLKSGYLTYVQDNTLFAAPFDLDELAITGAAEAMEPHLHTSLADETGAAGYDVSDDGVLVFVPESGVGTRLGFLDRDQNVQPFPLGVRRLRAARLSPDDTKVAAQIDDIDGTHIWIVAVDRSGAQRLTATGRNTSPVWSHDGRYVYFASARDGVSDIWRRPADLSAPAEKVIEDAGTELPEDASKDGQWLYFSRMSPGNSDIARVSLVGEPQVEILLDGAADELDCRVSRDGRFISFTSNESGHWDVNVLEIATRRRWMISATSGYFPIWTRDGSRIHYSSSGKFYDVDVRTDPEFSAGEPVPTEVDRTRLSMVFDIDRDGDRFLISYSDTDDRTESRPRATVVLNWFDEIEQRVTGGALR